MARPESCTLANTSREADHLQHEVDLAERDLSNHDVGFTTTRALHCAEIYNEILAFSYNQLARLSGDPPYEQVRRHDLLHVAAKQLNMDPRDFILDSGIYSFLSNLEYVPTVPGEKTGGLLTPALTKLLPQNIFQLAKEGSSHRGGYENMVSLFYGINEAATDRLVFDYKTGLAFWEEDYPSHVSPQQQLRRAPLEYFLITWLNDWTSGRYFWEAKDLDTMEDELSFELTMKHWTQADLEAAISAWSALLTAIESRLPDASRRQIQRLEPISRKALRKATFDSFSYAFLLNAPRPSFKYVGPGLTTLSEDIIGKLAVSQFDGDQDNAIKKEEDVAGITRGLFVSNTTLQTSDENMSGYILCGKTGLYSCPKLILGNYWLAFFRPGKREMLDYIFLNQNPSNNIRGGATSLHHIFERWRELIESGVWDINEDGVSTSNDWFFDAQNAKAIVVM